jgi:hypothetical protein
MDQINKTLNDKLGIILNLLDENKHEFEVMEKSIRNEDVKELIIQLIQKNGEYYNALTSTLEKIGKRKSANRHQRGFAATAYKEGKESNEDFLEKCSRSESIFERAYRDVLNSWFTQESLRDMMKDQLNEIKCTFMKMRILYMVKNNMIYPHSLRRRVLEA